MVTYVRVKDASTGHEFDLPDIHPWIAEGAVRLVNKAAYPPSHVERPAKFRIAPDRLGDSAVTTDPASQTVTE